eukprot:1161580-Pelagomonas_calceolata.AAC.11
MQPQNELEMASRRTKLGPVQILFRMSRLAPESLCVGACSLRQSFKCSYQARATLQSCQRHSEIEHAHEMGISTCQGPHLPPLSSIPSRTAGVAQANVLHAPQTFCMLHKHSACSTHILHAPHTSCMLHKCSACSTKNRPLDLLHGAQDLVLMQTFPRS